MSYFDSIANIFSYIKTFFCLTKLHRQSVQNILDIEKNQQNIELKGEMVELKREILELKTRLLQQEDIIFKLNQSTKESKELYNQKQSIILAKDKKIIKLEQSLSQNNQLHKEKESIILAKDEQIIKLEQSSRREQLYKEKLLKNNIELKNELSHKKQIIANLKKPLNSLMGNQETQASSSAYAMSKQRNEQESQLLHKYASSNFFSCLNSLIGNQETQASASAYAMSKQRNEQESRLPHHKCNSF